MLYYRYASLLTRCTAARPPSCRSRTDASEDCHELRGLGRDDQALPQITPRDRSRAAQSDPRSSCQERSGVAGPLESAASNTGANTTLIASLSRLAGAG